MLFRHLFSKWILTAQKDTLL